MRRRPFRNNQQGISVMYDAVLFIVMVSLSGVILLPALQSDIAIESSIDKKREHIVDEALNTLLVSRVDEFSYTIAGDIINGAATESGLTDTSDQGPYGNMLQWLLGHEQRHKTYANLITEDLGCQFRMPITLLGTNRFNIFTGEFDIKLKNEITKHLDEYLGDKYAYNFTAIWHPVKGIPLGGDIYIGPTPPQQDIHVAKTNIMMPYKPQIYVGGKEIVFSRYWFEKNVLEKTPIAQDLWFVINQYKRGNPPYNDPDYATVSLRENLTELIYGFLIYGIDDSSGNQLFPGIVNATLCYAFNKTRTALNRVEEKAVNAVMGEGMSSVDGMFGDIDADTAAPKSPLSFIFDKIKEEIKKQIDNMISSVTGSIEEGMDELEKIIKDNVMNMVQQFIEPYIEETMDYIFDRISVITLDRMYEELMEFLFGRISFNRAEVALTIWEVVDE